MGIVTRVINAGKCSVAKTSRHKETQWPDWRLDRRDWSNELAYALRALRASSDSCVGSGALDEEEDDEALCIEKRLDCELEGVRAVLDAGTDARTSEGKSERVGVVPYGWALLKL